MTDPKDIVLVSPIEQNKSVVAWDGKTHKRYFELEAVQMVQTWRKRAGWLKDIDIVFFNVNNAAISQATIGKLASLNCQVVNCTSQGEYHELGFLTEPLCGKIAEETLLDKQILIKIDLDMQITKPLGKETIEMAKQSVLVEQYTDYDKKGQRPQIGDFNPFDTCYIISSRKSGFYHQYYDLCQSDEILKSEAWAAQHKIDGDYFLEEFVIDYMFKNGIGNIIPMQNDIFGEGYKSIEEMEDDEVEKLHFFHHHLDLTQTGKTDVEQLAYMKRMSAVLSRCKSSPSNVMKSSASLCEFKKPAKKIDSVAGDKEIIKEFVDQASTPLNILVYIADKCNFNCSYCYNRKPRKSTLADLDGFFKFIQDLRRKQPSSRRVNVSLIGGEPTLHPDALSFCDRLLALDNVTVEVLTNFSQPLDYYLELLAKGVCLAASWHSQMDDKLNWDYVEKMKKIPMKYFASQQVEVRIMMENDNWENSRKVFFELYPLYKKYIEISLLTRDDGTPYEYTQKQLDEYEKLIILTKYKRDFFTVEYSDGTQKQVSFADMYLNPLVNFHLWKCNAGQDYIYMHCDGNVYNCQSYYENYKKPICNLFADGCEYKIEKFKPCICQVSYCACDFDVHKEKLIGR